MKNTEGSVVDGNTPTAACAFSSHIRTMYYGKTQENNVGAENMSKPSRNKSNLPFNEAFHVYSMLLKNENIV
jgi:hypothetical protein